MSLFNNKKKLFERGIDFCFYTKLFNPIHLEKLYIYIRRVNVCQVGGNQMINYSTSYESFYFLDGWMQSENLVNHWYKWIFNVTIMCKS